MKKIIALFAILLIWTGTAFAAQPNEPNGRQTYQLVNPAPIILSFEHYKTRGNRTPVVLSVGEMDCLLWMDPSGQVNERPELTPDQFPREPLFTIDLTGLSLSRGAEAVFFTAYEKNEIRSRWRAISTENTTSHTSHTSPVTKMVFHPHGMELHIGNLHLPFKHVRADFKEISPGLFQVRLNGPMPLIHHRLLYEKSSGTIYSTHSWDSTTPIKKDRAWAVKITAPDGPGNTMTPE